ncbi:Inositol monophosphatase, partial [mine drainage metagenome]
MVEAYSEELRLARDLAAEAAQLQTAAARMGFSVSEKSRCDIVTDVDRRIEERLLSVIAERFPGDGVIGEETGRYGPAAAERVWVVDPLDGTNNF